MSLGWSRWREVGWMLILVSAEIFSLNALANAHIVIRSLVRQISSHPHEDFIAHLILGPSVNCLPYRLSDLACIIPPLI